MPSKLDGNYLKALVICHGKSEVTIAKFISTNLHLNIKTYSKDKGKHSIQILSLKNVFKDKVFKNLNSFSKKYPVKIEKN